MRRLLSVVNRTNATSGLSRLFPDVVFRAVREKSTRHWGQSSQKSRDHAAASPWDGDGSGGLAEGQARGQHGGLVAADLASLQPSLDILKLDPVEATQEHEVEGIPRDLGLQAQPGQEPRHGGPQVTGRPDGRREFRASQRSSAWL
jgi:hypothetical protein